MPKSRLCLQYVTWAGETSLDAFWWSPTVMELFKRHIDVMTSRVNTYNGALPAPGGRRSPDMSRNRPRCRADGNLSNADIVWPYG